MIYAGTGETTIRIDVTHGDGMYKSTDAGLTWRHIGLRESRHIGEIRVHPDDPDLVYVAALGHASKDNPERGLYRSKDGGETGNSCCTSAIAQARSTSSLDPNNPRILFATMWQARRTFWSIDSGGPDSGLWRSRDGGDTWENISHRPGHARRHPRQDRRRRCHRRDRVACSRWSRPRAASAACTARTTSARRGRRCRRSPTSAGDRGTTSTSSLTRPTPTRCS